MSPEPTGVHGLLKQRKLFTHKIIRRRQLFHLELDGMKTKIIYGAEHHILLQTIDKNAGKRIGIIRARTKL